MWMSRAIVFNQSSHSLFTGLGRSGTTPKVAATAGLTAPHGKNSFRFLCAVVQIQPNGRSHHRQTPSRVTRRTVVMWLGMIEDGAAFGNSVQGASAQPDASIINDVIE